MKKHPFFRFVLPTNALIRLLACCSILLLDSCNQTKIDNVFFESTELSIESAREWFESENLSNARRSDDDDTRNEIFWEFASKQKANKKDDVVIVPITLQKKGDYTSFKHLWIYNDKNKKKTARIFEYIYDTKSPKSRMQGLKNFTGVMIIREANDRFLGGLKITNNKIEGVITKLKAGKREESIAPSTQKSGRVAYNVCASWTNCRNWHIDLFGLTVSGMYCFDEFHCYWVSTNGIDPAFTGYMIDIPTIPAGFANSAGISNDWSVGPPTTFNFGYAQNPCDGMNTMLNAQNDQQKEMFGVITTDGKYFIMPTKDNTKYTANFSFPVRGADGQIIINYIQGSPDPADPKYDGKYADDDISIEVYDRVNNRALLYRVAAFIHTHPIESSLDYNNPSDEDKTLASQWPSKIKQYIVTDNKLIEFNSGGRVKIENRPCK